MKRFRVRYYHITNGTVAYWGYNQVLDKWVMWCRDRTPHKTIDKVQADAGLAWVARNHDGYVLTLEVVDES